MNKLTGFYELRRLNLPTVPWEAYSKETYLSDEYLWAVRSAVIAGSDIGLPRKVGVSAKEAEEFANSLLQNLGKDDLVIYYPFFLSDVAGVIQLTEESTVIEAVEGDLWKLVDNHKLDTHIRFDKYGNEIDCNQKNILDKDMQEQLLKYVSRLRKSKQYHEAITDGKILQLEWSFARNCANDKQPVGSPYLVFYEMRTV